MTNLKMAPAAEGHAQATLERGTPETSTGLWVPRSNLFGRAESQTFRNRNRIGRAAATLCAVLPLAAMHSACAPSTAMRAPLRDPRLVVWTADPWVNGFPRDIKPTAEQQTDAIELCAARRECESAAVMITNAAEGVGTLHARVRVTRGAEPGLRRLRGKNITVREAVHVRARNGRLVADALPRLDEEGVLTIPAGETRQVWLTVRTHGLRAGRYGCRLVIEPLGGWARREVAVRLRVWDFELPARMPIAVFTWDYKLKGAQGQLRSKLLADLVAHGVNVFQISGSPKVVCDDAGNLLEKPDFSAWDELVALERLHGTFLFETWQFRDRPFTARSGKTLPYLSPPWVRAFGQWLRAFVAYTRERGLGYADWAFYPFDEYIGPEFVGLAKEIRRIDPKVRIFTDRMDKPEVVQAALPYADIWCPVDQHFADSKYREGFEAMRATGKPMWFYFCGWGQKVFRPLAHYRLMGWKAWHRKLQGCTYWNVFGRVGSAWDDFDGRHPDPGTVYIEPGGPVPSRRWEAFREGLEDYCALFLLDRELGRAKSNGSAARVARARQVLASAPADVLAASDGSGALYRWRRRIAEAILELRGATR